MAKPLESKHVLIAEDDEFVGPFFEKVLPLVGGATAELHKTSAAAQAAFDADPAKYDAVLTDKDTEPKDSGIRLAEHIRAKRPDMPIVLVTGATSDTTMEPALEAGTIDAFLPKPVSPDKLMEALQAAIAKHTETGAPAAGDPGTDIQNPPEVKELGEGPATGTAP